MSRDLLFALSAASLLAACSTGGAALTPDKLEAAQGKVHAMQPRDQALSALTPLLGEPTRTDEGSVSWFAPDGDGCRELRVGLMGDMVGNVELKKSACP
jgi:hypothetical protein